MSEPRGATEDPVSDYASYLRSFLTIKDRRINQLVTNEMERGVLWPEPLIQLNPSFEPGERLQSLIDQGALHPECLDIFRLKGDDGTIGEPFQLHKHQVESILAARAGDNYVLTTGTGSGKSLSYIIPIEGDDPGECDDDADNDSDGLFDCDDEDCAGSSVCRGGVIRSGADSVTARRC